MTAADRADAPLPRLFVALTVQVYDLPDARPFTVSGLALPDAECEPHVAVKLLIAAPLLAPALNDTLIAPLPAELAFKCVTAAGVPIVIGPTTADCGPTPAPVTAATVNVYVLPSTIPARMTVVVPCPATKVGVPTVEPEVGVIR